MEPRIGNTTVGSVAFRQRDNGVSPARLFALACGYHGNEPRFRAASGPAVINTADRRFEGPDFMLRESSFSDDTASFAWTTPDESLRFESEWTLCSATGVLRRRDRIVNTGSEPVVLHRCLSRFVFSPGAYEVYAQGSGWSSESQGRWLPLHASGIVLRNTWPGRTSEGGTPYAALRQEGADAGVAFHVVPTGNWQITVHALCAMNGRSFAIVELGLCDRDLRAPLAAGEAMDLPELLAQHLPGGKPHRAAAQLHAYANATIPSAFAEPPVVFNTWFHSFNVLDPERVREQLVAAKEIGCDAFVIDDGWFGAEAEGAVQHIGDWRERRNSAFAGKLKEFGDEVRAAGLGFGLWIESEGAVVDVPVRQEHPDWFVETESNRGRLDIENPDACAWVANEISTMIETYELAWVKVDFNFSLGTDARGTEFVGYTAALQRLWDELRARHPNTFIEGCASGAMRLELNSLRLCDAHFLSDNVNPSDALHIAQGTLLRIPPARLARWLVAQPVNDELAGTGAWRDSVDSVIVPCGATWAAAEKLPLDFAALATLPGVVGFSGDLAGMSDSAKDWLRWFVTFYKRERRALRRSVAHLLTPPEPMATRRGWIATQSLDPDTGSSLVVVHHLCDGSVGRAFRLRGLDRDAEYEIARLGPGEEAEPEVVVGAELMDLGLQVSLPTGFPQTPAAALYRVALAK